MRNENPTRLRGDADYRGVGQADHTAVKGIQEIDRWFPAAKADNDLLVEIGIRQESRRPHASGA